jgi:hypothetical protein
MVSVGGRRGDGNGTGMSEAMSEDLLHGSTLSLESEAPRTCARKSIAPLIHDLRGCQPQIHAFRWLIFTPERFQWSPRAALSLSKRAAWLWQLGRALPSLPGQCSDQPAILLNEMQPEFAPRPPGERPSAGDCRCTPSRAGHLRLDEPTPRPLPPAPNKAPNMQAGWLRREGEGRRRQGAGVRLKSGKILPAP